MSELTGTAALVRFGLRRDRVRIAVWLIGVAAFVLVSAASTEGIYPTQADLDVAAAVARDNPAALAFNGPAVALDTLGGQIAFQIGAFGLVLVALMSLLMVVRLTRTEEESGRSELIGSMAVGRYAPLAAAVVVVAAMDVAVGAVTTVSLLALALPPAGSVALGLSFTVLGLVFVGVAGITAQVTENPRVASGAAGAVLGIAFAVRAAGDVGDGTLSWFSPIGLVQKARPFGDERWWPLLVGLVLAGALALVAASLATHRDFGAGLIRPRPGPPSAGAAYDRPIGLAVRLQRGGIVWWALAVLLLGITYGSIADSVEDFVADNQAMADIMASSGGASIVDSYLSTSLLVLALIATGAALQASLKLRSEETAGRAEPVLATPVSRTSWLASHATVAAIGSGLVVVAGGLGLGGTYGAVIGDAGQAGRLMAAALAYLPAIWVVIGIALALIGVAPRAAQASWAVLAGAFLVAMFGTLLDLPGWARDLSPFQHVPQLPAADLSIVPLVLLLAVAVAATAVGVTGFQRRDIG